MARVIHATIEPIPERYSAVWNEWMPTVWPDHEFVGGGPVSTEISTGDFLDVHATNTWKARQTETLCSLVVELGAKDTIIFHDGWHPGILQVAYMRDALGLAFDIVSVWHAGSYSPADFVQRVGMARWAEHAERAFLRASDRVVVFSEYHARQLVELRGADGYDVAVCVFPYPVDHLQVKYPGKPRERRVVWMGNPDRFDRGDAYRKVAAAGIEVVLSHKVCGSKDSYYDLLQRSEYALSWPRSETFGIAANEADLLGCSVGVPDAYAYKEWRPPARFGRVEEFIEAVERGNRFTHCSPWVYAAERTLARNFMDMCLCG